MKKKYIIANWKEHKDTHEAKTWLQIIAQNRWQPDEKEVILCPPFTLLPTVKAEIARLNIPVKLGSQDFPAFENGAYTGEEPPGLLKEYIQYALIGHSERRKYFAETDELISQKVLLARKYTIEPIYCIQDVNTPVPSETSLIAYEPTFAIGTGTPDTPDNAQKAAKTIMTTHPEKTILYGGSVTGENVQSFTSQEHIHGVLVGTASLDATEFLHIITNA